MANVVLARYIKAEAAIQRKKGTFCAQSPAVSFTAPQKSPAAQHGKGNDAEVVPF